jgi:hypothetical protein
LRPIWFRWTRSLNRLLYWFRRRWGPTLRSGFRLWFRLLFRNLSFFFLDFIFLFLRIWFLIVSIRILIISTGTIIFRLRARLVSLLFLVILRFIFLLNFKILLSPPFTLTFFDRFLLWFRRCWIRTRFRLRPGFGLRLGLGLEFLCLIFFWLISFPTFFILFC